MVALACQDSDIPESFDDIELNIELRKETLEVIDEDDDMDSDTNNVLQEHDSDFETDNTGPKSMPSKPLVGNKRRTMG